MAMFWDVYGANAQVPCVMDLIPGQYHADILVGISTVDVSSYINQALAQYKMVRLPLTGQLSVASPLLVPSGGGIFGFNYQCTIKALPNFGDNPVIQNAVIAPTNNEQRDRNLTLVGFRIDGNLDANFTATQFGHGVKLYAVDGCIVDLQVVNPKGDGLMVQYSNGYEAIGSANIVGRIRTRRCDRQGVAIVCAEQVNLDIHDEETKRMSLCIEPDNPANFIRNCTFRVQSLHTGDGTDVSGGVSCAGDGLGCQPTNISIDFEVFEPGGYGALWRDAIGLTLRGSIYGGERGGLIGLGGGFGPSSVYFAGVRVTGTALSGFAARETTGSVYDGSVYIKDSGGTGVQIENASGGTLTARIENCSDVGLYLRNCADMIFPNLVCLNSRSHNVWLTGGSRGNRFPGMRSVGSQYGIGFFEEAGCNDNKAMQARMSGNGGGTISVAGASSYVMPEA